MKPSEHEVKFTELLDSMPTPELSKELVRLVIQHDISLEGANHMAEFFNRVEAEKCIGEVATYGAYAYPQQQFWTDI
jgi:hypothetical protein